MPLKHKQAGGHHGASVTMGKKKLCILEHSAQDSNDILHKSCGDKEDLVPCPKPASPAHQMASMGIREFSNKKAATQTLCIARQVINRSTIFFKQKATGFSKAILLFWFPSLRCFAYEIPATRQSLVPMSQSAAAALEEPVWQLAALRIVTLPAKQRESFFPLANWAGGRGDKDLLYNLPPADWHANVSLAEARLQC